jgi:signal transduction histidine kinase/FixJ family two-component response regulator
MNAGYSSGWCEESFGIPLTAVEVSCIAQGDEYCTFIMSPPNRIQEHLARFNDSGNNKFVKSDHYEIPTFFERKKVEEEMQRSRELAEESAKSKTDFIANMSHELRTPLSAILGFTSLLKKTKLDGLQGDYMDAIHNSGKTLLAIINDVLDLSKLDARQYKIEAIPFSVAELVKNIELMFTGQAKRKNIALVCKSDASLADTLLGDPMRLNQILVNLVGNAFKFTEKGGVYLTCTVSQNHEDRIDILFSVRDTGIGIPQEKIDIIFDRFTQADSNINRKYGGTGLGLAITRQLIELQGGNIWINNKLDQGVEFCFTITYNKFSGKRSHARHGVIRHRKSFAGKQVLLIEDNVMNQKLTTAMLKQSGFEITLAENGTVGIEWLANNIQFNHLAGVDIILMDIQMPGMDGYQTSQIIRNQLNLTVPIVAMTAHALAGEKDKCIQAGMNDYLAKPFNEDELLDTVGKWCSSEKNITDTDGSGLVDLSFLMTQTKGNHSLITEMITLFREQTPQHLATIRAAIDKRDYPLIYKTVHTLRNSTGFFGLEPHIEPDLVAMEKIARTNMGAGDILTYFQKIKPVLEAAVTELGDIKVLPLP